MQIDLQFLEKVAAITKQAGQIVENIAEAGFETNFKTGDDPVTTADHAANDHLQHHLLELLPEAGWLSEETRDTADRLTKEYVWIVDPIDGTREFVERVPHYAVSVALAKSGKVILGVVYNPARDECFSGLVGEGAWLNGSSIQAEYVPNHENESNPTPQSERAVETLADNPADSPAGSRAGSSASSLTENAAAGPLADNPAGNSTGDSTGDSARSPRLVALGSRSEIKRGEFKPFEGLLDVEAVGSIAYKLALVAAGRANTTFSLVPKNEWDLAGGVAIVEAAGGKATDKTGRPFTFNQKDTLTNGSLAAARDDYETVLQMIRNIER